MAREACPAPPPNKRHRDASRPGTASPAAPAAARGGCTGRRRQASVPMCRCARQPGRPLRARRLVHTERSVPATCATAALPKVVEPCSFSGASLKEVFSDQNLCSAMDASGGALLFRGWQVDSAAEFAAAVAALPMQLCRDYFPAEPGRRPLEHEGVWPTNSLRRTGAYLTPEVRLKKL